MAEDDGLVYDSSGRVQYNKEYHFSQGNTWTLEELEYLCMYINYDEARTLSFALGKTEGVIREKYRTLKNRGDDEFYKKAFKKRHGLL